MLPGSRQVVKRTSHAVTAVLLRERRYRSVAVLTSWCRGKLLERRVVARRRSEDCIRASHAASTVVRPNAHTYRGRLESCAFVPGSLVAPGATSVSRSAVDCGGNRAAGSFVVHVARIGELFDELVKRSKRVGQGKSIERNAREARAAYLERAIGCACEGLDELIREMRVQRGEHVSKETAADLIARATQLRTLLDCPRVGRRQDSRKHWHEDRDRADDCGRDDDRRKRDRRGRG